MVIIEKDTVYIVVIKKMMMKKNNDSHRKILNIFSPY